MRVSKICKIKGSTLYSSIIYVAIMIALFSGGIATGYHVMNNYKADALVRQCEVLDRSLQIYSKMHKAVLLNSVDIDENGKLKYYNTKIYPKNLEELGIIQDEQGYFSKDIDLSKFTYTVTRDANGSMTYKLGVVLPNGKFYTSSHSDKEI